MLRPDLPPGGPLHPHPLAGPALGIVAGLALGQLETAPWLAAPLALATTSARVRAPALGLLLGLLAGAPIHARSERPAWIEARAQPAVFDIEGVVRRSEPPAFGKAVLVVDVHRVGGVSPRRFGIRLRVPAGSAPAPNARVRGRVRMRAFDAAAPGRRASWARRGVHGEGRPIGALEIVEQGDGLLRDVRNAACSRFDRALARRDAALARALVAGDKGALFASDRDDVYGAGQAHLLAVSGLHVGLLLAATLWLLRRVRAGLRTTWVLLLLQVIVYVPFAGASPSAMRAGCAAILMLCARLLGREIRSTATLTVVFVLSFLWDAGACFERGFQLSFAAVAGILFLSPRLVRAMTRHRPALPGVRPRRRPVVRQALCVGLGAWLATAPLAAATFGRVCLFSAPLSVVAVPFVAVLILIGFLILLLAPVEGATHWLEPAFRHTADGLRALLHGCRELGLGAADAAPPTQLWWAAYVALALVAATQARLTLLATGGMTALLVERIASCG